MKRFSEAPSSLKLLGIGTLSLSSFLVLFLGAFIALLMWAPWWLALRVFDIPTLDVFRIFYAPAYTVVAPSLLFGGASGFVLSAVIARKSHASKKAILYTMLSVGLIGLFVATAFIPSVTAISATQVAEYNQFNNQPCTKYLFTDSTYTYAQDCATGIITQGGPTNAGGATGTNATTVIQNAVNAGGTILCTSGTFSIRLIKLPSFTNLNLSQCKLKGGYHFPSARTSSIGIILTNSLFDQTAYGKNANITVTGGYFTPSTNMIALAFAGVTNLRIEEPYIDLSSGYAGISLDGADQNVWLDSPQVVGPTTPPGYFNYGTELGGGPGLSGAIANKNIHELNPVLSGISGNAITVNGGEQNVEITSPHILMINKTSAIQPDQCIDIENGVSALTITNAIFSAISGNIMGGGISVGAASDVTLSNPTFLGSYLKNSIPISLGGSPGNVNGFRLVGGNFTGKLKTGYPFLFFNGGVGTTYKGIEVTGVRFHPLAGGEFWGDTGGIAFGVTQVDIHDNQLTNIANTEYVFDNSAVNTFAAGSFFQVHDNYWDGTGAGWITGSLASNTKFTANLGYNPVAASTYTACASVCTYTNNDGYDETFTLLAANGISAWSCNGQTGISTTAAAFTCTVPPSGTMTITWATTAPTFKKVPLFA